MAEAEMLGRGNFGVKFNHSHPQFLNDFKWFIHLKFPRFGLSLGFAQILKFHLRSRIDHFIH